MYCAPCKLYGGTTLLATTGFNDWKNSNVIIDHDNNSEHRECLAKHVSRSIVSQRVDSNLVIQFQQEVTYWRDVLKRVVEVVKFLASRGLPFQGNDEIIGSVRIGHFLGCIEMISK